MVRRNWSSESWRSEAALFCVAEEFEVGVVSLLRDVALLESLFDGAAGFVGVEAILERALGDQGAHLDEEVGNLARLGAEEAEVADAGGVDGCASRCTI